MKMRYLGLFALAPLAAQCQPACTPPPPPPVETTTTTTTQPEVTTTTTVAAAPYTLSVSCSPLQGTFTAGPRDIVVQGGFGFGPTPQTVIAAGTSQTLIWQSFGGDVVYNPLPEITFGVIDAANGSTIDERTLVLAEQCPGGWTAPVAGESIVSFERWTCDDNAGFQGESLSVFLSVPAGTDTSGFTMWANGVLRSTWDEAIFDPGISQIGWPIVGAPSVNPTWAPSFHAEVRNPSGAVLYSNTWTQTSPDLAAANCTILFAD